MVRISDIFKQKGQIPEPEEPHKGKEKEEPASPPSSEQPPKEKPAEYTEKVEAKSREGVEVSKIMAGREGGAEEMRVVKAMHQVQLDPQESLKIYHRALEIVKEILNKKQKSLSSLLDLNEAYEIIKVIIDRIVLGDRELIVLTAGGYQEENYLPGHMVNVSLLSIDVGLSLGYNKSKLLELGMGAFLHDIGMVKVIDIAKQPRKLSAGEVKEIQKHTLYSVDMLSAVKNMEEGVTSIVKQTHERTNGSGYPGGLKGEQIHEYAKIVAIVDVYEALVHPRAYRKAMGHHEAIKELFSASSAKFFETHILKVLINRIGLYPVGCWVELNTGEIGKVSATNTDSPLRPKVSIIFSSEKKKLSQIKPIDLSQHSNVYIKKSINPQELNLKFE